ncbi:hypothetical protein D3C85_1422130 [compost metagenome]
MRGTAHHGDTDALRSGALCRAVQGTADAVRPQHVVAIEQAGNATVRHLLQYLRAGLDLAAEHAVDVAADQVQAMGAMAQQFAFKEYPGHYLGDFGIGAGLFEQPLDEGGERLHVVMCGLSHCGCLGNGTGLAIRSRHRSARARIRSARSRAAHSCCAHRKRYAASVRR